jgi:hypothetical protein
MFAARGGEAHKSALPGGKGFPSGIHANRPNSLGASARLRPGARRAVRG